ncbi:MAG TPA: BON domain-containing protein, partial [Acidimicrobiales bacterium]
MAWITRKDRTTYSWNDVPTEYLPSDREMKSALVHRLNENPYTEDAAIKVDVDHRVIVLGGEVETPEAKRVAGDDAWDIPGVMDVSNQLVVAAA